MKRVDVYTWRVPSNRRANMVYTVKQDRWGDWSCGCKGFSYNHSCSHLLKVLEVVDTPEGRAESLASDCDQRYWFHGMVVSSVEGFPQYALCFFKRFGQIYVLANLRGSSFLSGSLADLLAVVLPWCPRGYLIASNRQFRLDALFSLYTMSEGGLGL